MREQTKAWLINSRDSAGLEALFADLEDERKRANQSMLNKAKEMNDRVFYEAGVHEGIKRIITLLKLPLNPPEAGKP